VPATDPIAGGDRQDPQAGLQWPVVAQELEVLRDEEDEAIEREE